MSIVEELKDLKNWSKKCDIFYTYECPNGGYLCY